MAISDLATFQQFTAAFPDWKLINIVEELYFLSINLVTQGTMSTFNPEAPNAPVIKGGPTIDFWLQRVSNVVFNGSTLSFKTHGYTYVCDGANANIKIVPH